jgi:SpoVK/Ycf46/Vps4 family AAA+-type ATPase
VNRDIPNLADSGGYEECVRQGTYLVLQVNTHQIFVQFGLVNVPAKKAQSTFTGELTASQREAYQSLAHFLDLRLNPRIAGGIQPRPHALIVGPSGVGKTALVRAFAEDLTGERGFRCPAFFIDPGTFLPDGAKAEPHTLRAIKEWMWREVGQVRAGILFIDELDKMYGEHDWSRAIVQNVFALLDNRLGSLTYWSEEDSRLLEQKILIIGAGTWQEVQKESLSDPGNITRRGARMDRIEAASAIPEELLFRFSADVIFLDPMIETEIQERIAQIHRDLNEPVKASTVADLAHRSVVSNREMRWLEAYVSRLLRRQFLADRAAEEAHDDPELGLN